MRIDAVSTGPQFKSNVKLVCNRQARESLLSTKNFKTFVNNIANNGETSTVVLMPMSKTFCFYEQSIKDRVTGKFKGYHGCYKKDYIFHPENASEGLPPLVPAWEDTSFKALNNSSKDNIEIYVVKEIGGKPHIGVSRVPADQNIDFAEYRYKCAESNMPDHPMPDWMDKRLYKYLAPTSDSRVMLLYSGLYGQDTDDLYKNEDFINCIEWLDKEFINKEKEAQIIINPNSKFPSGSYYIGVYMTQPKGDRIIQYGNTICWNPESYKAYEELKARVKMELKDNYVSFPNLLSQQ